MGPQDCVTWELVRKNPRATADLLTQSLHFNKIPGGFVCTFRFGRPLVMDPWDGSYST